MKDVLHAFLIIQNGDVTISRNRTDSSSNDDDDDDNDNECSH